MTAPAHDVAQRVRQLHRDDPIAAQLGVELVAVEDDTVELSMIVAEAHVGGHGRCHGANLFALCDIAMSYVGNRFDGQAFATHAAIDFVAPVSLGDLVIARATEPSRRGRAAICDVELTVGEEVVAQFRGNTLRVT